MQDNLSIPFHITCIDKLYSTKVELVWFGITTDSFILASHNNVDYFKIYCNSTVYTLTLKPNESLYLLSNKYHIVKIILTKGEAAVAGNINSLITSDYSSPDIDISKKSFNNVFSSLFYIGANNCSLVDASNLLLPAKKIPYGCYQLMFKNCFRLKYPPKILPAKTVSAMAYSQMFYNCVSLVSIPDILGKKFKYDACSKMFYGCINLTFISNFAKDINCVDSYAFHLCFDKCKNIKQFPKRFTIKKIIAKYAFCNNMFSVDLPLDYLLSLNLDIAKSPSLRGQYYCLSNKLNYESFKGKISVFNFNWIFNFAV